LGFFFMISNREELNGSRIAELDFPAYTRCKSNDLVEYAKGVRLVTAFGVVVNHRKPIDVALASSRVTVDDLDPSGAFVASQVTGFRLRRKLSKEGLAECFRILDELGHYNLLSAVD
jgi:hypothetical protein